MGEHGDDDLGSSATMAVASDPGTVPDRPEAMAQQPAHTVVGHGANHSAAAVSGLDGTMAASPSQPAPAVSAAGSADDLLRNIAAAPPVRAPLPNAVIRGAGPRDYPELQPVDPKHFVPGSEIARGGMGRIVKARDRRLGRDVAIKELLVATGELRMRFEREARITAQLQHPAIVNILEAGTWPSGEPFYVMKLVDGVSLDRKIAACKTLADRLALLPSMTTVVEALAFAHDRKIIHRDLKPANVLVGKFGEIVVIDWGLAKDLRATSEPRHDQDASASRTDFGALYRDVNASETMAGSVMGTPSYMPAEQAKGEDVDERADVYALGAMLYHLLVGAPPFTGKTADEILKKVMAGPPKRIDEVVDAVPSDLVAIVTKAMAFRAGDRYATAAELADDLRKFQTGQLVGAHRYTTRERLRRFARHYRIQLTAASIALVALAGIGGFSVYRIIDERDAAVAARTEADAQRKLADEHRNRADTQRDAAEGLVGFVMNDLKPGLTRIGQLRLMNGIAKQVDGYYQRVTTVETLDSKAIARRAAAEWTLGDVYLDSDKDADAQRLFEAAIATLNGRSDAPFVLADAQIGVVKALTDLGKQADALAMIAKGLAALDAAPPGAGTELARAQFERYRGINQAGAGKQADAIASYSSAIDRLSTAIANAPKDRDLRIELAKNYDRRSDARNATADRAGALADANAGLAVREQLGAEDPGDLKNQQGIGVSYSKLFTMAVGGNDAAGAQRAAERELAIDGRLADLDPSNAEWERAYLNAAEAAAEVDDDQNHYDAAYARLEHPLELAKALVERSDSLEAKDQYTNLLCKASNILNEAMKLDKALELAQRCLQVSEQLHAGTPDNSDYYRGVGIAHERLGDTHSQKQEYRQAADEYRQRLAVDEELMRRDPDNPRRAIDVVSTKFNIGLALVHLPDHRDEAVALMQAGVDKLHELKSAGKLSRQFEAAVPEYEKQLAAAKQGR